MHMYMLWQQGALRLHDVSDAARLIVFGLLRLDAHVSFLLGGWSRTKGQFCVKVIDELSVCNADDMLNISLRAARVGLYISELSAKLRVSENPPMPLARAMFPASFGCVGIPLATVPAHAPLRRRTDDPSATGASCSNTSAAGTKVAIHRDRNSLHDGQQQETDGKQGNQHKKASCVVIGMADVTERDIVLEATGIDVSTSAFEQVVARRSRSVWVGIDNNELVVKLIRNVEAGRLEARNREQFAKVCPQRAAMPVIAVEHRGTVLVFLFSCLSHCCCCCRERLICDKTRSNGPSSAS